MALVKRINEFTCCGKTMQHPELVVHLTEAHGYVKETQCSRSLIQALDGTDFYSNTFVWSIPCGGKVIEVIQVSSGPRGRGDLLRDMLDD